MPQYVIFSNVETEHEAVVGVNSEGQPFLTNIQSQFLVFTDKAKALGYMWKNKDNPKLPNLSLYWFHWYVRKEEV
jgi:hypothetical protein